MLFITPPLKASYLGFVSHVNARVNSKHGTDILQGRTVSLQTLQSKSTTEQSLHILGLPMRREYKKVSK